MDGFGQILQPYFLFLIARNKSPVVVDYLVMAESPLLILTIVVITYSSRPTLQFNRQQNPYVDLGVLEMSSPVSLSDELRSLFL